MYLLHSQTTFEMSLQEKYSYVLSNEIFGEDLPLLLFPMRHCRTLREQFSEMKSISPDFMYYFYQAR